MTRLEHEWREWLAGNPRVRAMLPEDVTKIKTVWLHGAQSVLVALAASHPEGPKDLEALKATADALNDEIMAGIARAHGRLD